MLLDKHPLVGRGNQFTGDPETRRAGVHAEPLSSKGIGALV